MAATTEQTHRFAEKLRHDADDLRLNMKPSGLLHEAADMIDAMQEELNAERLEVIGAIVRGQTLQDTLQVLVNALAQLFDGGVVGYDPSDIRSAIYDAKYPKHVENALMVAHHAAREAYWRAIDVLKATK